MDRIKYLEMAAGIAKSNLEYAIDLLDRKPSPEELLRLRRQYGVGATMAALQAEHTRLNQIKQRARNAEIRAAV